ncbi:MAG: hypothetical protein JXR88_03610 [Clostridia bacterium]|nr:hypothetical protein [Clostridia bacterium]
MNKYLIVGLMALFFSGIIFSLIFMLLLRTKDVRNRKKVKVKINNVVLEELDKFLLYGGYWITVETWLGLQILFLAVAMATIISADGMVHRMRNMMMTLVALEAVFFVIGRLEIKTRNESINLDLCRLQESLYFQSDTGVDREAVLLAVYEKINDPMLKRIIKDIIFAYSLKQDVIEKIENLKVISNNINLIVFSNTLIQDFRIGESDENIEAQAVVTRRLISNRAIMERKSSRFKMILIGVLLGMLFIFLVVTPTVIEFTQDLNKIIE